MKLAEAKAECERWFAYLQSQKDKSLALQKIASERRSGLIDHAESQRRIRSIDNCSVRVFDGADLEKAVRVLLKNLKD
jgi:hypothetical protein